MFFFLEGFFLTGGYPITFEKKEILKALVFTYIVLLVLLIYLMLCQVFEEKYYCD